MTIIDQIVQGTIIRETTKAILFRIQKINQEIWFPRSQILIVEGGIKASEWILTQKQLNIVDIVMTNPTESESDISNSIPQEPIFNIPLYHRRRINFNRPRKPQGMSDEEEVLWLESLQN